MKPVLIVEGKAHEVRAIDYFEGNVHKVMISDGKTLVTYYNEKYAQYYVENPLKVNINECLKWVGQYDALHKEIQKELEAKESQMTRIAIENMHNELPFTPNEARKQYFDLLNQQIGLMDALEVIEIFMEDDVDLSGGKEDE